MSTHPLLGKTFVAAEGQPAPAVQNETSSSGGKKRRRNRGRGNAHQNFSQEGTSNVHLTSSLASSDSAAFAPRISRDLYRSQPNPLRGRRGSRGGRGTLGAERGRGGTAVQSLPSHAVQFIPARQADVVSPAPRAQLLPPTASASSCMNGAARKASLEFSDQMGTEAPRRQPPVIQFPAAHPLLGTVIPGPASNWNVRQCASSDKVQTSTASSLNSTFVPAKAEVTRPHGAYQGLTQLGNTLVKVTQTSRLPVQGQRKAVSADLRPEQQQQYPARLAGASQSPRHLQSNFVDRNTGREFRPSAGIVSDRLPNGQPMAFVPHLHFRELQAGLAVYIHFSTSLDML